MVESKARKARTFRSKVDIIRILQEQAQSGQNVKSFCAARGIAGGTFHWWKQKYAMGEDVPRSGFSSLHLLPEAGLFAVVGTIKIYQAVTAAYLKELMS